MYILLIDFWHLCREQGLPWIRRDHGRWSYHHTHRHLCTSIKPKPSPSVSDSYASPPHLMPGLVAVFVLVLLCLCIYSVYATRKAHKEEKKANVAVLGRWREVGEMRVKSMDIPRLAKPESAVVHTKPARPLDKETQRDRTQPLRKVKQNTKKEVRSTKAPTRSTETETSTARTSRARQLTLPSQIMSTEEHDKQPSLMPDPGERNAVRVVRARRTRDGSPSSQTSRSSRERRDRRREEDRKNQKTRRPR